MPSARSWLRAKYTPYACEEKSVQERGWKRRKGEGRRRRREQKQKQKRERKREEERRKETVQRVFTLSRRGQRLRACT